MAYNKHFAFTMIELIFVIVIIGVLSAIAVPKFKGMRDQADISKGRADISAIQSAILSYRQSQVIKGNASWIDHLSDDNTTLFSYNSLLLSGIKSGDGDGEWRRTGTNSYTYRVGGVSVPFSYDNTTGTFDCNTSSGTTAQKDVCKKLMN